MQIYCDQLSLTTIAVAAECRLRRRRLAPTVLALDPLVATRWGWVKIALLRLLRLRVREAEFFAGHLRGSSGQVAYLEAKKRTTLNSDAAWSVVRRCRLLRRLNEDWGRDTIQLYLAQQLWLPVEYVYQRVFVTKALVRGASCDGLLVIRCPDELLPSDLSPLPDGIEVRFQRQRAIVFRRLAATVVATVRRRFRRAEPNRSAVPAASAGQPGRPPDPDFPGVLLLQEELLELDKSYRTQPHWCEATAPQRGYNVFVVPVTPFPAVHPATRRQLEDKGIYAVSPQGLISILWKSQDAATRRLFRSILRCLMGIATAWLSPSTITIFRVLRLFVDALPVARLCAEWDVRVALVSKPYVRYAMSTFLIAPEVGVTSVLFQSSNLPFLTYAMMGTPDRIFGMSEMFRARYTHIGIANRWVYTEIGYAYDAAFDHVRPRARELRARLTCRGARFVICYFDENCDDGKFGLTSSSDYRKELQVLADDVMADETLGLIVKSQFARNTPSSNPAMRPAVERVIETGRYLELHRGEHRNVFLPAEAALAADISIGHAVGATASMEAALTGARSVMVNPYGLRSDNDALYASADIVFDDMAAALAAISEFRQGHGHRQSLGRWDGIISAFDPHRDGHGTDRLRENIEQLILCDGSLTTDQGAET